MAIFLLAVPKDITESVSAEQRTEAAASVLTRAFEGYSELVGNHYANEPEIKHPGGGVSSSILVWKRKDEKNSVETKKDWWAFTSGQDTADELLQNVARRGQTLEYVEPVWGTYLAVFGERYVNCTTIWNTVPALETAHYAETDEFIFVSNRPMLTAMALAGGDASKIELSESYLNQYLLFGFNLDDTSPFQRVKTLNVDTALQIRNGCTSIIPVPYGLNSALPKFHSEAEGAFALQNALTSAADRAFKDFNGKHVQLRMSGGKDSRMLLGMIRNLGLPVYGLTFGRPADEETRVAQALCREANIPLEITAPKSVPEETLAGKIDRTILMSDGLPASEPHTSLYEGSSPRQPGDAITLGQWPLMKGGQAKRFNYSDEALYAALKRQSAWIVGEELESWYDEFLDRWTEDTPVNAGIEYLYLFARNFRSGRWLQAHINLYDRDAFIAYPIADSEVAAVSDALTMTEKVSQRSLFSALDGIWPEALEIPLSNKGSWKFETNGANPALGYDTYEARHSEIPEYVPGDDMFVDPILDTYRAKEYTESLGRELARELLDSPHVETLKDKVKPEFWAAIEQFPDGVLQIPENSSRREMLKFIWRMYLANRWLTKDWLRKQ